MILKTCISFFEKTHKAFSNVQFILLSLFFSKKQSRTRIKFSRHKKTTAHPLKNLHVSLLKGGVVKSV